MSTPDFDLDHALLVARNAALAAGEVINRYYRDGVAVRLKSDQTPVTQADEESEQRIREVLLAAYPDHAIYGEEGGHTGSGDWLWLVDPIDGTKSFVRGYPFFSTQIALMHRGEIVLGVSHASAFGETAWARKGGGAFLDGRPIKVADTTDFAKATLSTGNLKTLARGPGWNALASLVLGANRSRGFGDFYHYHLLASGRIDLVLESDVNILDIAPLVLIIREAGGVFTDLQGNDIDLATTSVLAGTPAVHAHALGALRGA
jgi:histidinol-phosphatase